MLTLSASADPRQPGGPYVRHRRHGRARHGPGRRRGRPALPRRPLVPAGPVPGVDRRPKHYIPLVREVEHAARIFFPDRRIQVSVQWLRRIVSSTAGGWQGARHDEWIAPCLTTAGSEPWTRATNVTVSQSILDALARIGCVQGVGVGHLFTAADLLLNGPRTAWATMSPEISGRVLRLLCTGPGKPSSTGVHLAALPDRRRMRRFRGLGGTTLLPWTTDRPALEDVRGLLLGASLGQFVGHPPDAHAGLDDTDRRLDRSQPGPRVRSLDRRARPTARCAYSPAGCSSGSRWRGLPGGRGWPEPLASVPALSDAIWSHLQAALDTANPPVSYPRRVPLAPGLGAYPVHGDRPGDHAAARQHQVNPGTVDNGKRRLTDYKSDCAVTFPLAHFRQLPEDLPTALPKPGVRSGSDNQLVILHTAVAPSLQAIENTWAGNNDESHFGVHADGTVWQWVDLEHQAQANGGANARAISIETTNPPIPGNKDGLTPEWSAGQLDSLRRIVAWSCLRYDIPTSVPAGAANTSTGIALHVFGVRQNAAGPAQWRTWLAARCSRPAALGAAPAGGLSVPDEVWSAAIGKVCPGPVRTFQFLTSTGGSLLRLPNPVADLNDNRAVVSVPNPMPDSGLVSLIQADVTAHVLHDWPDPPMP